MSRSIAWFGPIAFTVAIALALPLTVAADDNHNDTPDTHAHGLSDVWALARGGQIYDNWMATLEADTPMQTHPAYPAAGKKKGAATWRCKECHGWDYQGKDGAYAKGSHFTGIKGVRGVVGMAPEKIHDIIMNKQHAYTDQMITHSAMEKLAVFLSKGQHDLDRYVDRASKAARGNSIRSTAVPPTWRRSRARQPAATRCRLPRRYKPKREAERSRPGRNTTSRKIWLRRAGPETCMPFLPRSKKDRCGPLLSPRRKRCPGPTPQWIQQKTPTTVFYRQVLIVECRRSICSLS